MPTSSQIYSMMISFDIMNLNWEDQASKTGKLLHLASSTPPYGGSNRSSNSTEDTSFDVLGSEVFGINGTPFNSVQSLKM